MRTGALLSVLLSAGYVGWAPARADGAEPEPSGAIPSGTLAVTPEYRLLYGIPVLGGELTAAFGLDDRADKRFQAEAALTAFYGRTRAGLPLFRTSLGALFDLRFAGLHAGGLLGVGLAQLRRAGGGEWMKSATISTNLSVGPELVLTPGVVVSLDATLAVDWIAGATLVDFWGPGVGLRARVF